MAVIAEQVRHVAELVHGVSQKWQSIPGKLSVFMSNLGGGSRIGKASDDVVAIRQKGFQKLTSGFPDVSLITCSLGRLRVK